MLGIQDIVDAIGVLEDASFIKGLYPARRPLASRALLHGATAWAAALPVNDQPQSQHLAPAFPLAGGGLAPLRAKAEAIGSGDLTNMWSGQSARLPSGQLTETLAADALLHFSRLAASTQ
jgi:hypothetical protein